MHSLARPGDLRFAHHAEHGDDGFAGVRGALAHGHVNQNGHSDHAGHLSVAPQTVHVGRVLALVVPPIVRHAAGDEENQ